MQSVDRLDEVARLGRENTGHKRLRVAIDERKPTRLDLDHDLVVALECVEHVVELELDLRDLPRDERLRRLVAVTEPAAERFATYQRLLAAPVPLLGRTRPRDVVR